MHQGSIPLAGYRRALKFAAPYWPSLVLVLLTGVAATLFGLAQPYISEKLLIDEALLKRNFDKLLTVSGLMLAATLLNFALNTFSSYQYVKASAAILFRHTAGALSSSAHALAAILGVQQDGRCGLADQQRRGGSAARVGGQPAQRAFERRVSGGQRGHHGEPQCRNCFC
mgnify:CR=1 FL=1